MNDPPEQDHLADADRDLKLEDGGSGRSSTKLDPTFGESTRDQGRPAPLFGSGGSRGTERYSPLTVSDLIGPNQSSQRVQDRHLSRRGRSVQRRGWRGGRHQAAPFRVGFEVSRHGHHQREESSEVSFTDQNRDSVHFSKQYVAKRGGRGGSVRGRGRAKGWRGGAAVVNRDSVRHREEPSGSGRLPRRPQGIVNPRGFRYMTREEINHLTVCSESEKVIRYITENEGGFLAAYRYYQNCQDPVRLKQLIKMLYLLVKSDDNDLAARIVAHVFDDSGDSSKGNLAFRTYLDSLIKRMGVETLMPHVVSQNLEHLGYLIEIGTFAISAVPLSVMFTFPYQSVNNTVQKLTQVDGDDEHLLVPKALALTEEFTNAPTQVMPQPLQSVGCDSIAPPPQHITELPVLPTTDEIHPFAAEPYLRPNITTGGYTDWEHYLDMQFRLMREDFVAPLRDGIRTLEQKGAADKYLSEVRVYEGVSLGSKVCLFSGVGFQIYFDVRKFQRVNWEHSKRLIFGSLLCLSRDNFQTILFATVVKRDPKLLKYGMVTVQFEGDNIKDVFQIDPTERFVMVESTAYFEAYRHILEGIKRASIVHLTDRLQIFKKYLVDCQITLPVPVPRYLQLSDKCFNLKDVINIKTDIPDVVVTDDSSWPPSENTSLDPSQLQAFRAALTQEVSVIQGPPGTGKTYIGLKVVEAQIANKEKFRSNNFPILVLCYTNHALDQFLEGIVSIETQGSRKLNIIRIGGRCKTESLEKYGLKTKIDAIRAQRLLPSDLAHRSSAAYHQIRSHKEEIEYAQDSVKETKGRDKLLKLRTLQNCISQQHVNQLTRGHTTQRGREIDVWLKLWHIHEEEEEDEEEETPPEKEEVAPIVDEEITENFTESDDEYIQVDAEAIKLEDERMFEGEELVVPRISNPTSVPLDLFAPNTYDEQRKEREWSVVQISKDERRKRIKRGQTNKPMSQKEANSVTNVWRLSLKRRWSLYLYWVNEFIRHQKRLIADKVLMYNDFCKEYITVRKEIDHYAIEEADIVGMTTTGAAKYNHILSKMIPKIVIIEEAAEVFEAHVFTSLTPSVQQLIMIGDHKQLRPKANCYKLEKKYELCVSLFERLARNGFPIYTLEVQHRMRPEIASLICPSIYEKLLNNENVEAYDHVKGVGSNIFFIDHKYPEKANEDNDRSHSNHHEAEFLVALCKYLLKQGYLPSEITVLTMYRGQLLELKKRMRKQDYSGVRVAAVDDFQGEENEIILLSLVRSNSDGKIGFLSIENRICVSLSRAKIGLFVIGNLSMLRDKDNTVWPQILQELTEKRCIGEALPLHCEIHSKNKVMAKTAEDFLKCPEGGCQQKCDSRLNCGHSCPRLCHPIDREHIYVKCKQKCQNKLGCDHICRYKCFNCVDGCPRCSEPVIKRIELCGHEIQMRCHEDPSTFTCPEPCKHVLDCRHTCQNRCSVPHTQYCQVLVEKKLPCDHLKNIPCYLDESKAECMKPCDASLNCGHKCVGRCGLCQRGRLHVRCRSKCERILVCGHICNFPCTPTCPPCTENCNNYCFHSKCQRKCYEPCVPCMEPCKWKCKHYRCSRLCSEMCDRPPCNEPCKKSLECGHPCIGLCGENCPTKCRICDKEEVCEIFFGNEEDEDARFIQLEECGHVIEVTACDAWMEQESDESKPSEVQFKSCPKCKTQIRKSLRYGNIVKKTLQDYENIKKQQLISSSDELVKKFLQVKCQVGEVSSILLSPLIELLKHMETVLKPRNPGFRKKGAKKSLTPNLVDKFNFQLSYSMCIVTMIKQLSSMQSIAGVVHGPLKTEYNTSIEDIQHDITTLVEFLVQRFLSDQQTDDIRSEVYRLMSLIKLLDLSCKLRAHERYATLTVNEQLELSSEVKRVQNSGWTTDKLKEKDHNEVVKFVANMSEKYKVDGLTDTERIEIVKAVGLSKGHWFKCPNGHYYCIGECGGAMEEAKCPQCGATIGGRQHRLRDDNQLAPEMDGARHAAWSEHTNLANFDPDQFR